MKKLIMSALLVLTITVCTVSTTAFVAEGRNNNGMPEAIENLEKRVAELEANAAQDDEPAESDLAAVVAEQAARIDALEAELEQVKHEAALAFRYKTLEVQWTTFMEARNKVAYDWMCDYDGGHGGFYTLDGPQVNIEKAAEWILMTSTEREAFLESYRYNNEEHYHNRLDGLNNQISTLAEDPFAIAPKNIHYAGDWQMWWEWDDVSGDYVLVERQWQY